MFFTHVAGTAAVIIRSTKKSKPNLFPRPFSDMSWGDVRSINERIFPSAPLYVLGKAEQANKQRRASSQSELLPQIRALLSYCTIRVNGIDSVSEPEVAVDVNV